MIKIIPNEPVEKVKQEPRYELSVCIGYGEHCDDTFTRNTLTIVDSTKGRFDAWNYITAKEAERIYRFIKKILTEHPGDHIPLNDAWQLVYDDAETYMYEDLMTKKEIQQFGKICHRYEDLFTNSVDHNWYGLVDINIFYYDENGEKFNCEVV